MKILKKIFFVMMMLLVGAGAAYAAESDLTKITLKDVNGMEYKFGKQDKETYVKFWASWCPICLSGLEELDKLSGENKNFEIVTIVSPGMKGEKKSQDFTKWYNSLGYKNLKVLLDEKGELSKMFNVRVYPTSVVLSKEGKVKKVLPGHLEKSEIEKMFDSKMDKKMMMDDKMMNKDEMKKDMMNDKMMTKDGMKNDMMHKEEMKDKKMMNDKMGMEKKTAN